MGSGLCKSDQNSAPGNRRFKGVRRATSGEEYRERYAIPEGKYTVKLRGEKHCIINSATYLPTGDVVMSDMINRKLKLFNCNFQLISELEFQTAVQYISASPNLPLIYAAFPDRIRQVHVDGGELKRSGFIKTPGTCRAICVNKFDGKAISMSLDEDTGQVNLLTPGGNLQMELIEDPQGEQLFIRPESIVVTRDLNLVVADKGTQSVLGLQPDGEVLFEYTGIRYPTAIVCDERNYIYVAGPNNIHQLTENGDLIKLFVTKAEIGFSPLSLSYNEEKKHLLVTGKGPKVTLFKLT
ncbi:hypothetical protein ACF0H5_008174 [Mactra antiquata]